MNIDGYTCCLCLRELQNGQINIKVEYLIGIDLDFTICDSCKKGHPDIGNTIKNSIRDRLIQYRIHHFVE